VTSFQDQVANLCDELAPALFLAVGSDTCLIDEQFKSPNWFLRLLSYPPHPIDAADNLYGIAPHTDFDFMTFVLEDDIGGVQVKHHLTGQFIDIPPRKGSLTLVLGDMFQVLSNGRLKAVPHSVRNKSFVRYRYSVASFWLPNLRTTITPHLNGDKDVHYKPMVCGEYVMSKLNKHYDYDA